ncbi:cell wall metabolism sensor histidine kinase WalK [Halobacillus sp. A5]|uniref:sensor histidine kinase n=1 Tax=Halobacillus sp. A5 TaxID=2880263 RepID=UPI0020A6CA4A|nr:HAMP domain-containing sensor histidine kinase [Halobacillus sp. A5]MCP3027457.1 HAMP domain-containing histidine kinase [Halobacillus sp. A5]
MKLQYQLNAAFAVVILIVMTITVFFVYSLIMDMLIQDERSQLEERAELLKQITEEQDASVRLPQLTQLVQDQNYPLLLFDLNQDEVLFSTLPANTAVDWLDRYDEELVDEEVWEDQSGESYVAYNIGVAPDSAQRILVMVTPLDDLQIVQNAFAQRMIRIIIIGLLLALAVSYFMTNRLVTPLSHLQKEVKKIEKRKFDQVEPVKASGEIKEVERSVRHMSEELERYINSQKQFFQNASHELKTPLMSIQGYAEGIRDGIFKGDEAERGLDVMVSETERLKKIVNEMILLAKLDSSEDVYHPEQVNVADVVAQAKDRLFPLANEKGVELYYSGEDAFYSYVDRERVLQAFINIIGNAVRHAHGKVEILSQITGDRISVQVIDDGNGIPEELLPQLFQRFIKGKEGETGLGLAISRAIIERSGGTISAENNSGAGAKFEIQLNQRMEDRQ